MGIAKTLITTTFNVEAANTFVRSINATNYYMFVGRHIPYDATDSEIPEPDNAVKTISQVYNDMVFAKRVEPANVTQMVRKVMWTENTVYDVYDYNDPELNSRDFFVVVNDNSEYNVYKCLDNNGGSPSTAVPTRVGNDADLSPFITSDGYMWKYMYTIDKETYDEFSTKALVPLIANTSVVSNAVPGTVDTFNIIDGGQGYDNYIAAGVFRSSDIRMGGSETIYGAPATASGINDFYRGCVIKITSGTGANQYRKIISYDGASATKRFILDAPFSIIPSPNDTYVVYPYLYVWGDGSETIPAEGMAVIDGAANSITSIEVLSSGSGYRSAYVVPGAVPVNQTSQIQMSEIITLDIGFSAANVMPVLSPSYGHGGNPWEELGASYACVSIKFEGDENGLFSNLNEYRQVGLIKDPKYSNVTLNIDTAETFGAFSVGEELYQAKSIKLFGTASANNNSDIISKKDIGKISNTVAIINAGSGYDSTSNNMLVFNNTGTTGAGAAGTFANNESGHITSVTITDQGAGYDIPPTATINPSAGGSGGHLLITMANPEETEYNYALSVGDIVSIEGPSARHITTVKSVISPYQFTISSNTTVGFESATVSLISVESVGKVVSVNQSQIVIKDVDGRFVEGAKIIGKDSGASAIIAQSNTSFNAITINNRNAFGFKQANQLYSLVGDFSPSSSLFVEDEKIEQELLVKYGRGTGYLHHVEINSGSNDDILYISNKQGEFYLDASNDKPVRGESSGAILSNLSNKYNGELVMDSGKIVYYENIGPITRSSNKSENIKIVLSF